MKILKKSTQIPTEETLQQPQESAEVSGKKSFSQVMGIIGKVIYHLRKVFMAIPVIWCSLKLAAYNTQNLPEQVGLDLQTTGEYAYLISRETAVMAPLIITGACLVLMFFSRRATYPWIISIFTLILPFFLLLTNLYPA